jgi:DnaJ-class molecular chaperone
MDYYAVLGVSKNATPDEIKKAYRKLASQHHPDKGGDKAKFQEVQSAYETLSDPNKRAQYDNPPPQGFPHGFGFQQGVNINDIFGQMFGGMHVDPFGRSQRQVLRTQFTVSLQDAYTGTNQTLQLQTQQGPIVINVNIPAGVITGDQMRYDNVVNNAILLVEFVVLPDLQFDRRGNDLLSNHSISVLDLIVGTSFEFTTISGKTVMVHVRPNTQPYMQLKLPKHGMPIKGTPHYGDQLILLKPFIPDNISDDIVNAILRNKTN